MAKTSVADWDTTAADNTDINDISLAENVMKPPAVNNAFRETMAQIAQWTGEGTIASAATCDIGAEDEEFLNVTGTTTITSFGTVRAGTKRRLLFADALTLTHNATSLILPGAANITTAAGDVAVFVSEGSGNWRCVAYSPAAPVPNTANGQYKFPATQNASADANTLDDYQEGTYTPVVIGGITAGTGTYTGQVGEYTKIGNVMHFAVDVAWTNHTGSGGIEITLPIEPSGTAAVPFAVTANGLALSAGGKFLGAQININTLRIALVETPTVGGTLAGVGMDTSATVRVAGIYFV